MHGKKLRLCVAASLLGSVDHEKVFEGLQSLHDEGIRPRWLVLDDGWQSTSNMEAANGALDSTPASVVAREVGRGQDSIGCSVRFSWCNLIGAVEASSFSADTPLGL